jgi:hypothetical protein
MNPPQADARGILHFFGGSISRIHSWAYPAFVAGGYYGGVGRPWSSAKADEALGTRYPKDKES